jgi:hypothetical protein
VRSEGGSGCLKAQELNPDQQATAGSMKVEPDAGSQDDWNNFNGGPLLM